MVDDGPDRQSLHFDVTAVEAIALSLGATSVTVRSRHSVASLIVTLRRQHPAMAAHEFFATLSRDLTRWGHRRTSARNLAELAKFHHEFRGEALAYLDRLNWLQCQELMNLSPSRRLAFIERVVAERISGRQLRELVRQQNIDDRRQQELAEELVRRLGDMLHAATFPSEHLSRHLPGIESCLVQLDPSRYTVAVNEAAGQLESLSANWGAIATWLRTAGARASRASDSES